MKQHDILVSINGVLEWVCGVFQDDLSRAIADAIECIGKAEYVGHKSYALVNGQWVETASTH